ncbi:DUF4157 domain-containing protein [Mucilaginibacter sp. L196]|uniref:eCIS core domain-containing protein n=1 Tax=Mucilaginibacter sp. L196 TaxID=1641870 RepID=UPI00131A8E13|nr:DUF4157 domain-containing protein [Mucilaginibacter sp. L196]
MADNSPKVKQFEASQVLANNHITNKIVQRKENTEEEPVHGKFEPVQKQANNTGLPDNLKVGIENLSGISMNDVRVNYNSPKPAQLQAHAYAHGTDIHIAPGQEKHLPHEAWHVVQQKQGRVQPTLQMKGTTPVNDNEGLEIEADSMGKKVMALAFQLRSNQSLNVTSKSNKLGTAQRVIIQGADADESSDIASIGYSRLISQSEIQNTNEFLKEEIMEKKYFQSINLME